MNSQELVGGSLVACIWNLRNYDSRTVKDHAILVDFRTGRVTLVFYIRKYLLNEQPLGFARLVIESYFRNFLYSFCEA